MGRGGNDHSTLELKRTPAISLGQLIDIYKDRAAANRWNESFYAHGCCWDAAAEFAELAKRHGIDAEWAEFWVQGHAGYGDAKGGYEVHAVAVLYLPSGPVSVDWTAAQYDIEGDNAFPFIQPFDESQIQVTARSDKPVNCNGDWLETDWLDSLAA